MLMKITVLIASTSNRSIFSTITLRNISMIVPISRSHYFLKQFKISTNLLKWCACVCAHACVCMRVCEMIDICV